MTDSSAVFSLPQLDVSQLMDTWEEHQKVMIPGQHFEAILLLTRFQHGGECLKFNIIHVHRVLFSCLWLY